MLEYYCICSVTYKFGIIAMLSGLIGVPLGSILAQRLRSRYPRIDPMVCAFGLLISSPLLFAASLFASVNCSVCYALIFLGEIFLNLNWSIVADILLVSIHWMMMISSIPSLCYRLWSEHGDHRALWYPLLLVLERRPYNWPSFVLHEQHSLCYSHNKRLSAGHSQ